MAGAMSEQTSSFEPGASVGDVEVVSDDPIRPLAIAHDCEEVLVGGRRERRENHLDYLFERDGVRLKARANLDTPGVVSIYPANATAPGPTHTVPAPDLREAVIAFLMRRFDEIQELTLTGYQTIWRREP